MTTKHHKMAKAKQVFENILDGDDRNASLNVDDEGGVRNRASKRKITKNDEIYGSEFNDMRKGRILVDSNSEDSSDEDDDINVYIQSDIAQLNTNQVAFNSSNFGQIIQPTASPSVPFVPHVEHNFVPKPRNAKERFSISSKFHYWTDEMDVLLLEAHGLYGNQWMKVAAHVGHGKTDRHCYKRWRNHLNPDVGARKYLPWSAEEDTLLNELATKHIVVRPQQKNKIDWAQVSAVLNREGKDCKARHKHLELQAKIETGPITEEECQVIREAVTSWSDKCRGRWASLGRDMNRDPKELLNKWVEMNVGEDGIVNEVGAAAAANGVGEEAVLPDYSDSEEEDMRSKIAVGAKATKSAASKALKPKDFSETARMQHSLSRFAWTDATDDLLREGYNIHGKSWRKVAEFVGHGATNVQCQKRWTRNANPDMMNREKPEWTEERVNELTALVQQHSSQHSYGKGDGVTVNWSTVSKAMNLHYKHCMIKWKALQIAKMKRGKYTPEEDAIIVTRVREWQGKGQGLWAALEKELNRNGASVLTRWNLTLSKKYGLVAGADELLTAVPKSETPAGL